MMRKIRLLLRVASVALPVAAVVKELRTPAEQRQWHGTLAGVVPYELRFPTVERLRRANWDPDSDRLLAPPVFGVGWSLNFARLVQLVRPG